MPCQEESNFQRDSGKKSDGLAKSDREAVTYSVLDGNALLHQAWATRTDSLKKLRASLRITGQVQGVFYRQSAAAEATRLGLCGYVRNLPDGAVDAVAEGKAEAVQRFVAWCNRGPPAARVDTVQVRESDAQGDFVGFSVER